MARRIGEVFVAVEADTSLFRTQAITGVTKALAGIDGKIPVTADTAAARAQIDALKARMTDLNKVLANITVGANGKPAEAEIRRIQLKLAELAKLTASITLDADTSKLDTAIAKEELLLAKLDEQASTIKMDADDKALTLKILLLEARAKSLAKQLGEMDEDGDDSILLAKLLNVEAQLNVLSAEARHIVMDAEDNLLLRRIAESEVALEGLKKQAADLQIGGKVDLATLAGAELQMLGLEKAAKALNPEIAATNLALVTGARNFGRFGLGALTARVALFGGLSAVSGFHIALDAIVETLAVIVPAVLTAAFGLAAFAVAGSDAAIAVANRMKNLHTVFDATGQAIPPLNSNIENLHATVRPQVWQLYGDAIIIAKNKGDIFNTWAVKTGGFIDTVAAKITILATSTGTGLQKFLASGSRDLAEFGRIATSLGDAFGKLIQVTEQTHIAETLLAIVGAGAKLFDIFTKIPVPLLALVIGIHGLYLWSGLAATGLVALLRPLSAIAASAVGTKAASTAVKDLAETGGGGKIAILGATFRDLGNNLKALPGRVVTLTKSFLSLANDNPWIVIGVVAVAALVGLGVWLLRTKDYTNGLVTSLQNLVTHSTVFNVINATGTALIKTNQALAVSQGKLNAAIGAGGKDTAAYRQGVGGLTATSMEAAGATKQLAEEHVKLADQLQTTTGHLVDITHKFGTQGLAGAEALAALAGVKVSDLLSKDSTTWAIAIQKIAGVVSGYANMGQGATQLANDINVLTIAQSSQLQNMQALNTAFDNFDKIVSGPTSGFVTFANAVTRFGNDAGVAGAQIGGLGGAAVVTSRRMTTASLQLTSDFQDTFNAATQMTDAIRLTGTGMTNQVGITKNLVQVMIPMAGTSKIAAAEISSLAQEAGGPATTNLQLLAKWAGKTNDPLSKAQAAAAAAGISFSNMSLDAQKLGTTLQQDLSADMNVAVENAVGLQGAMNAVALDVKNADTTTAKGQADRQTLLNDLKILGISGTQATDVLNTITGGLHVQAKAFDTTSPQAQAFIADVQTLSKQSKTANSDLTVLTKSIVEHGVKSDQEKGARAQLIKDLEKSGLNAQTATRLVDTYITQLGKIPKSEVTRIEAVASGTGGIKITGTGSASGAGGIRLTNFAGGGRVGGHGSPKADDQMIMASSGEFMINAASASKLGLPLLSRLNRYASGGVVGLGNSADRLMPYTSGQDNADAAKAIKAMVTEAVNALKASAAATGTGGDIVSYAKSFVGKIPYFFGGTGLTADDCSGFTQAVYQHFGYSSTPRTSEAQGSWVKLTPQPQAGGLAFYHSPAGGPDPGHVAIINNGAQSVISQGGPQGVRGPNIIPLHALPLLWTGIPPGGFSGGPSASAASGAGGAQTWMKAHLGDYNWGANQWSPLLNLWNRESGWRWNATNPSSGAYGIPQSLPADKMASVGADWRTNPVTQMKWGAEYIRGVYGNPSGAWGHELADGWYAKGGPIGMAAGGPFKTVGAMRSALTAKQAGERGKFFGLEHSFQIGPPSGRTRLTVQELHTLATRQATEQLAYAKLAGAGLTKTNLGHFGATVRSLETTAKDSALNRSAASGGHPVFAHDLRGFIHDLSVLSGRTIPAGSLTGPGSSGKPPGPPLPAVTHVTGGDVGNTIGAFLDSVMAPFAQGGLVKSFDKGGWLAPGLTMAYNGTGKSERVGGTGDITVSFEVTPVGQPVRRVPDRLAEKERQGQGRWAGPAGLWLPLKVFPTFHF